MREHLDATHTANEIGLLRDVHRGSVLVVEGADDARVFERFRAQDGLCEVVVAFGKRPALDTLKILKRRGMAKLTCVIVDADFWHLTGEVPDDPDVLLTSFHDLEMDICMTEALENVLREYADPARIAHLESVEGTDIRTVFMRRLHGISALRFANAQAGLFLRFRDTDLSPFVDPDTLRIDVERFISAVLERSKSGVNRHQVMAGAEAARVEDVDLPQVVRGHDLALVLGVAIHGVIGTCDETTARNVESLLRLAFGRECFERLSLHAAISSWEDRTGGVILQ